MRCWEGMNSKKTYQSPLIAMRVRRLISMTCLFTFIGRQVGARGVEEHKGKLSQ